MSRWISNFVKRNCTICPCHRLSRPTCEISNESVRFMSRWIIYFIKRNCTICPCHTLSRPTREISNESVRFMSRWIINFIKRNCAICPWHTLSGQLVKFQTNLCDIWASECAILSNEIVLFVPAIGFPLPLVKFQMNLPHLWICEYAILCAIMDSPHSQRPRSLSPKRLDSNILWKDNPGSMAYLNVWS